MSDKKVLVLGGGPGGYVCAIRLAQFGIDVTLVEKERVGGVCLNVGCIPSKALIAASEIYHDVKDNAVKFGIITDNPRYDWGKIMEHKSDAVDKLTSGVAKLLKSHGVNVIKGEARLVSSNQAIVIRQGAEEEKIDFTHAVVATGSSPLELPNFPYTHPAVGHATHALSYDKPPASMLIIGGGYIGLELGMVYAAFGTKVTIVEMTETILPGVDPDAVRLVSKNLRKLGVEVITQSKAANFNDMGDHVWVEVDTPKGKKVVETEKILVTVGRKPNSYDIGLYPAGVKTDERFYVKTDIWQRTNMPHIYAIGDVTGTPFLAHRASAQGERAAAAIAEREETAPELNIIPGVVFTHPEIATVGLQEHEAKAKGIDVRVGKFPYAANGKALASLKDEGFVKLISSTDGKLLGALIAGEGASTMIGELALAVGIKANVTKIAQTIHPHPTLSEIAMEAAAAAEGLCIHLMPPKK